jgi:ferredoxin
LGIDPTGLIGDFPDYGENLEWLSRDEARAAIHKLDQEGLVHSVWTFDTPFIGGMCNCDQDCLAYRAQIGTGMLQVFFPAEYVAAINWDACTGCKLCRGHCPFGAIRYSAANDKCLIDPNLCYGCGVCRAICKKSAIHLERRQRLFRWQRRYSQPGRYHVKVDGCQNARDCRACFLHRGFCDHPGRAWRRSICKRLGRAGCLDLTLHELQGVRVCLPPKGHYDTLRRIEKWNMSI